LVTFGLSTTKSRNRFFWQPSWALVLQKLVAMRTCPFLWLNFAGEALRKSHFRWQTESKKLQEKWGNGEREQWGEIKVRARVALQPSPPVPGLSCVPSRAWMSGWIDAVVFFLLIFTPYIYSIYILFAVIVVFAISRGLHGRIFYVAYSYWVAGVHKKGFHLLGGISIGCISVNRWPSIRTRWANCGFYSDAICRVWSTILQA